MNIRHHLLARVILGCAIVLLPGCGGPKYSSDFKSWLGLQLAEQYPLRLDGISIEEIAGAGGESVFSFDGTATTTTDLFSVRPILGPERVDDLESQLRALGNVPNDIAREAGVLEFVDELRQMTPSPALVEVVTPEGSRVKISGRAKATLGNDGWVFTTSQMNIDGLKGSARPDHAVVKGSDEATAIQTKIEDTLQRFQKATQAMATMMGERERVAAAEREARMKKEEEENRQAEELRKAEEAKKAQEAAEKRAAVVGSFSNGAMFDIVWQGGDMRGRLWATIREGVEMGGVYSFEGTLYEDSSKSGLAKPFSATISGEGTAEAPITVTIKTAYAEGEPKHYRHRDSGQGFLTPDAKYEFELQRTESQADFVGDLKESFMFTFGPKGPIRFLWKPADK